MLVLSRKEGERIVIGDNITLIISKVSGNRVTIGIEAPKDLTVVRGELQKGSSNDPAVSPPTTPKASRTTLRDFAASVLPMQRQVG